ncbi:MAG TPA: molybdenum cofactor guanylyltransferase [Planctomycetia bacterium]|nr:molybdenum cofactor guanylyltransferase [Planctomycetia bacterium]
MNAPAGIVLCGGRSRRMGAPKALLDFAGQPLLLRMLGILRQACDPLLVVAAPDQELPPLPADVLVARDSRPHDGPLHGIAAGLEALPPGADMAFVVGCDSPLLAPAWIRFVASKLGASDIALPVAGGFEQPLAAVYRRAVAGTARSLLAADRHRPVFLTETHSAVLIPESELRAVDPDLDSLRDADTPAELAALLGRFQSHAAKA